MNTIKTYPYDLEHIKALHLDPENVTALEITSREGEYAYMCSYLTQKCGCYSSLQLASLNNCDNIDDDGRCSGEENNENQQFTLGLGTFKIIHNGETIHFIHAVHGKPQGLSCLTYYTTLVLLTSGIHKINVLSSFVDEVVSWGSDTDTKLINIYSWDIERHYWTNTISKRQRDMSTVILPEGIKKKLVNDLDNFLDESTSSWYAKHGIPYKRSYLFYGAPGTGKTSTIAALAGYITRNIAYLHVSDPKMTDSMLKKALQRVPEKSVVVLEDVDALFSLNRTNLGDIPLSFSGLLNALDGIGGKDASIFVLTSNHIERLDPALIRPGRIDVHIEFPICTDEQIELMFMQFYEEASEPLAKEFVGRVTKLSESIKDLTTATLQQYFIAHRTSSAAEALLGVDAEMPSPFSKPNLASVAVLTREDNLQDCESVAPS